MTWTFKQTPSSRLLITFTSRVPQHAQLRGVGVHAHHYHFRPLLLHRASSHAEGEDAAGGGGGDGLYMDSGGGPCAPPSVWT